MASYNLSLFWRRRLPIKLTQCLETISIYTTLGMYFLSHGIGLAKSCVSGFVALVPARNCVTSIPAGSPTLVFHTTIASANAENGGGKRELGASRAPICLIWNDAVSCRRNIPCA